MERYNETLSSFFAVRGKRSEIGPPGLSLEIEPNGPPPGWLASHPPRLDDPTETPSAKGGRRGDDSAPRPEQSSDRSSEATGEE